MCAAPSPALATSLRSLGGQAEQLAMPPRAEYSASGRIALLAAAQFPQARRAIRADGSDPARRRREKSACSGLRGDGGRASVPGTW